jgi:hypothetical protein
MVDPYEIPPGAARPREDGFEELPEPEPGPGWRRVRIALVVLVGLVLVGLVMTKLTSGGSHQHTLAPTGDTTLAPPAPTSSVPAPTPTPSQRVTVNAYTGLTCPVGAGCFGLRSVPAGSLALVRTAFPKSRVVSVAEVLTTIDASPSELWARRITVRTGSATVTITVLRMDRPTRSSAYSSGTDRAGPTETTTVTTTNYPFTVGVRVVSPSTTRFSTSQLVKLAQDPRLVVVA